MTKQAELKQQAYASSLKSRALSVLIYLIDRSNKDLTCYPAIPTMAGQLHISVSTVKRALKELVDAGYIEKTARFRERNCGQSSNLYTLLFAEQTTTSNNENTFAKAGRDHIDTSNEEKSSKDHAVKYITFSTLSEKAKSEQKSSLPETIQEDEKECFVSCGRPIRSVFCTPVQISALIGNSKSQIVSDKIGTPLLLLPPHSPFSRWTGAESILRPP
jgi:DNA-binding transcriptional regulator YhcF (GntR family)